MKSPVFRRMTALSLIALSSSACDGDSIIDRPETVSSAGSTRPQPGIEKPNLFDPTQNRYAFKHMETFFPTVRVDAGTGVPYVFERASVARDLERVEFVFRNPLTHATSRNSVAQMLRQTRTDAFVVLKDGKLVYEQYFDGQTAQTRHQMMSVTKSLAGMLAASLVAEGRLSREARVADYVPELDDSAYGDATVGQVLDMTVGVRFTEQYDDPASDFGAYGIALGITPEPTGYAGPRSIRAYLPTLKKEGTHGHAFHYVSPNTDVLCWVTERAAGMPFDKMLSERIWSKIGASRDAFVIVDSQSTPSCGGGLNATALDLANVGQMLLDEGWFNGQRILPAEVVADIANGGDRAAFGRSLEGSTSMPGWSYRDQFWVRHYANRAYAAYGIFGQTLYVDPVARVVIVKQSSPPQPDNIELDAYTDAGFDAIISALSSAAQIHGPGA